MSKRRPPKPDPDTPPIIFVRMRTVMKMTGLGRSTIYRLIAAGQFPPARRLGPRASAFVSDEVVQWSQSRPVTG